MKIDDIGKLLSVQIDPEITKKDATQSKDSFSALLNDEISNVGGAEKSMEASGVNNFMNFPTLAAFSTDSERTNRISAVEDVLAKLQALEQGLGGGMPPRNLDGIIQDLGNVSSSLEEKLRGTQGDSNLNDIAEEANILAFMESVKWKRGDYL